MPRGTIPSPNIWHHPATYELENKAFDPDDLVFSAMREHVSWDGRVLLDLGCGTGYHLPRFASAAARVIGVEPHPDLVALARRRTRDLDNVEVLAGSAQEVPLPDASVDVVHVRWAYFFGPGSGPGLAEIARVVRRGGTALVVDNDGTRSTFGRWFSQGYPEIDQAAVERFWSRHGWSRTPVLTRMSFATEADLEAVVRIEFDRETADRIMSERPGREVDYAVNIWSRTF